MTIFFFAEIEKLTLNSFNTTGLGPRLRSNSSSDTLWKGKSEITEMMSMPKVCSGLILCPRERKRKPMASLLGYKVFWAQMSA